jgi:hypothetical protein
LVPVSLGFEFDVCFSVVDEMDWMVLFTEFGQSRLTSWRPEKQIGRRVRSCGDSLVKHKPKLVYCVRTNEHCQAGA